MLHLRMLFASLLVANLLQLTYAQSFSSTVQVVSTSFNSTRQGNIVVSINGGASGAICDSNWTLADATVICRQLGYDVSSSGLVTAQSDSAYGITSTSAVMTQVTCVGNELDIANCAFVSTVANPQYQCGNSSYAGVTCFGAYVGTNSTGVVTLVTCSNTATMQLVNGTGSALTNGRLQVSENGVSWGTVCAQSFTQTDAQVVCAALCGGVSAYAVAYPGSYYGSGSPLRVVLSNVSCVGTESNLLQCPSNGFNASTSCTDAVGVNCAAQYSQTPTGTLTCGGASMQVLFAQLSNPLVTSITPTNATACQNASSWSFSSTYPSYTITLPYFDCGTTRTVLYDASGLPAYYQYNNGILITVTSGTSVVSRTSQYQMSVQCTVQRSTASANSLQTTIVTLNNQQNNFTIPIQASINFYADPGFSVLLQPPVQVLLSSAVYAQVTVSQTAASLGYRVLVPTCVASPYSNFSSPLYYLIQNNCVNDSTTVKFTTSSAQLVEFMFYSFRFVGNYSSVYLQCYTLLCAANDFSGLCSGQCGGGSSRRKRDVQQMPVRTVLVNGPLYPSPTGPDFASSLVYSPVNDTAVAVMQSSLSENGVISFLADSSTNSQSTDVTMSEWNIWTTSVANPLCKSTLVLLFPAFLLVNYAF